MAGPAMQPANHRRVRIRQRKFARAADQSASFQRPQTPRLSHSSAKLGCVRIVDEARNRAGYCDRCTARKSGGSDSIRYPALNGSIATLPRPVPGDSR